jgi:hypothetical protein
MVGGEKEVQARRKVNDRSPGVKFREGRMIA